jgi:hypothetical protein
MYAPCRCAACSPKPGANCGWYLRAGRPGSRAAGAGACRRGRLPARARGRAGRAHREWSRRKSGSRRSSSRLRICALPPAGPGKPPRPRPAGAPMRSGPASPPAPRPPRPPRPPPFAAGAASAALKMRCRVRSYSCSRSAGALRAAGAPLGVRRCGRERAAGSGRAGRAPGGGPAGVAVCQAVPHGVLPLRLLAQQLGRLRGRRGVGAALVRRQVRQPQLRAAPPHTAFSAVHGTAPGRGLEVSQCRSASRRCVEPRSHGWARLACTRRYAYRGPAVRPARGVQRGRPPAAARTGAGHVRPRPVGGGRPAAAPWARECGRS